MYTHICNIYIYTCNIYIYTYLYIIIYILIYVLYIIYHTSNVDKFHPGMIIDNAHQEDLGYWSWCGSWDEFSWDEKVLGEVMGEAMGNQ